MQISHKPYEFEKGKRNYQKDERKPYLESDCAIETLIGTHRIEE